MPRIGLHQLGQRGRFTLPCLFGIRASTVGLRLGVIVKDREVALGTELELETFIEEVDWEEFLS